MTELELLARSFAEQLFDQAGEKKVAYIVIVSDESDVGSSSNIPRAFAVALCRVYLARIAALEELGIPEQRAAVPDLETKH